jgi:trimeric autotransporter adhesin
MKHRLIPCFSAFFLVVWMSWLGWSLPAQAAESFTLVTSQVGANSARLSWVGTTTTGPFEVRWRQQGSSAWITISEITGSTYLLNDLPDGQSYEWQMHPTNSTSWFGDPATFTTSYGCSPPSLRSPYSVSASGVSLSWYFYNSTSPNSAFTLDYKMSEATSWSSIGGIPNRFGDGGNYTLQDLIPGATYVWRVRAACSPVSETGTFVTPACTLTNPRHEPQSTSAKLRWSVVLGATYTIQWRPQGGSWATVSNVPPPPYSYTGEFSLTSLTPNTTYEWQAQAVCGATAGPLTPLLSFTANCNPPNSVSLLSSTANRVSVSWINPYRNADYGYGNQFQYRPKTPANAPWITNSFNVYTSYSNPNYDGYGTATDLIPNTEYEFRVQTTCPNSATSVYTDPPVGGSTTSCTNTATGLNGGPSGYTGAYLYWSGSYENAYAVQFRPSGVTSWSQVGPWWAGRMSDELSNLTSGITYEWRVITYCAPSVSAVTTTDSKTFVTGACAINRLTGLYSTYIDFNSAQLYWGESGPQSSGYVVRYRPVGTDAYTTLPQQTIQSVSLSNLLENTAYEWQVSAVCTTSATSYSFTAPLTFTTSCQNPASSLRTANNTLTTIELQWDNPYTGSTGTRTYTVRYRPAGGDWTTTSLVVNYYAAVASLTGLQLNTVYEWGVARQCSATSSSTFTSGSSFTTTCRNTT